MTTIFTIDHNETELGKRMDEASEVQRAVSGFYPAANGMGGNHRLVKIHHDAAGPRVYEVPGESEDIVAARLVEAGMTVASKKHCPLVVSLG